MAAYYGNMMAKMSPMPPMPPKVLTAYAVANARWSTAVTKINAVSSKAALVVAYAAIAASLTSAQANTVTTAMPRAKAPAVPWEAPIAATAVPREAPIAATAVPREAAMKVAMAVPREAAMEVAMAVPR